MSGAPADGDSGRRDLVKAFFSGLGLVLLSGWALVAGHALGRAPRTRRRVVLSATELSRLRDQGRLIKDSVLVWRHGAELEALSLRCPHLGCTVQVAAKGFVCPCHGSRFDAAGRRVHGPARGDLARWEVRAQADGLVVEPAAGS